MDSLVGNTLLGRYRLERFIGRGGMAMVYEAWDEKRAVSVALKLVHDDLAEDYVFLRRFAREAQTLERLKHPHIVRFLGFEEGEGKAFLVMEYIKGVTLRRRLRDLGRPLTLAEALTLLQPVCSALHYAHQLDIYHCDIKPANVFIEDGGRVLLGDFGIAHLGESATVTMTVMGTPAYMSPEQCRGGVRLDARTDIYSLGIALYEVLTLDRPFKGETAQTEGTIHERVRWEQIFAQPASPRLANPDIPPAVEQTILRALAKDPDRRFHGAMAFFTAFQEAAGVSALDLTAAEETVIEPLTGAAAISSGARHPSGPGPVPPAGPPPGSGVTGSAAAEPPKSSRRTVMMAILMLLVAAVIGASFYFIRQGPSSPAEERQFTRMPGGDGTATLAVAAAPPATVTTGAEETAVSPEVTDAPQATATSTTVPATMTPQPTPTLEPSNTFVLYALNASNDMMDNGEYAIIEQGLADHLETLDPAINAGLLAFGHQLRASQEGACSASNVELREPMRPNNASAIWQSMQGLNPVGIAPLADALVAAHNYFGVGSDQVQALFVLTDGESFCDEPEDLLRKVATRQRDTTHVLPIYIFGIGLSDSEGAPFRALIDLDGMKGGYFDISSAAQLTEQLDDVVETLSS